MGSRSDLASALRNTPSASTGQADGGTKARCSSPEGTVSMDTVKDWDIKVDVLVGYGIIVSVITYFFVAGYDRWKEQYRLGNGDTLWIECGSVEDGDGRLTLSPGIDPGTGTVRCQVNRKR